MEFWLFLALAAALLSGANTLLNRVVMLRHKEWWTFALAFQLIGAVLFLPFLAGGQLPSEPLPWALALVASVLWAAIAVIAFKSYHYAEVSLRTPVTRLRIILIVLFAVSVGEAVSANKLLGALVVFAGVVVATWKEKPLGSFGEKGVQLALVVAFLTAAAYVVDKAASPSFSSAAYSFLQFALPAAWIWLAMPKHLELRSIKPQLAIVALTALLGAAYYWMQIAAYQTGPVSIVAPVVELSSLVAVVGGIVFLGERRHWGRKIIGVIIACAGAAIMVG